MSLEWQCVTSSVLCLLSLGNKVKFIRAPLIATDNRPAAPQSVIHCSGWSRERGLVGVRHQTPPGEDEIMTGIENGVRNDVIISIC